MKDHRIGPRNGALAAASLFANAVRALAQALQARDAYTGGHSARVTLYALQIAQELDLSPGQQRELRLAAELHDVGKIGVPDEVLLKPGRLTREEQRQVEMHPVIGEQILRPLLFEHPTVLAAVRWHHERMDGRGYPDGLKGEEIPLPARIIAVADALDAMTSARPYRAALPLPAVVTELERNTGTQFDPSCVCALLRALARHPGLICGASTKLTLIGLLGRPVFERLTREGCLVAPARVLFGAGGGLEGTIRKHSGWALGAPDPPLERNGPVWDKSTQSFCWVGPP